LFHWYFKEFWRVEKESAVAFFAWIKNRNREGYFSRWRKFMKTVPHDYGRPEASAKGARAAS
jgi:hypothetical protein